MTRIIGILSGKGGVGKTCTAINIGAALNSFGKDVVVVDANLTTPNIGLHLGVPVLPVTLHDVLRGKKHISEATYLHKSGLKVIPGSISIEDLKNIEPENLEKVFKDINNEIAIVDSSAGLGNTTLATLNAVDDVLIIVNPELPAVTDALKTIKLAEKFNKNVLGVVITRHSNSSLEMPLKNIQLLLEKPILATIPEDRNIKISLNKKDAAVYTSPKSNVAIAYKKLAAKLIGKKYHEEKEETKEKGLLHKIFKSLGLIK